MINLTLIDRSHLDEVPETFFDAKAEFGLSAAVSALGPEVRCSFSGTDMPVDNWSISDLLVNLRELAGADLKIMTLRMALRSESDAEDLAHDCARFIRMLSKLEEQRGGTGLMVLAAEADTPDLSKVLFQSGSFRDLIEDHQ